MANLEDDAEFEVAAHPIRGTDLYFGEIEGLPGCFTQGTLSEIFEMLEEIFSLYQTEKDADSPKADSSGRPNQLETYADVELALQSQLWKIIAQGNFFDAWQNPTGDCRCFLNRDRQTKLAKPTSEAFKKLLQECQTSKHRRCP